MNLLRENPLLQFLVLGLAIVIGVAAINALIFASLSAAIAASPWLAYALVGGSILLALGALSVPVWRGLSANTKHRLQMEAAQQELRSSLQDRENQLQETRDHLSFEITEREDLEEQLRDTMEEMTVVDEVAQVISAAQDVNQVYAGFALKIKQLVDFDRLEVSIVDHRASAYTIEYYSGIPIPGYALGSANLLDGAAIHQVTVTGQTLCREDIGSDPTYAADPEYLRLELKASIIAPLVSKGRVIGAVSLYDHRRGSYKAAQQGILERVAHQIASTVDNVRLHDELEASTEEIAVGDGVARIITSALDTDEVYEKFALEMKKLVDFDRVHITAVDRSSDNFTLKYVYGTPLPGRPIGSVRSLDGTLTGKIVATGKTVSRPDIAADPVFSVDQAHLKLGLRSSIMVPLISKSRVIGAMALGSAKLRAYTPRDRDAGVILDGGRGRPSYLRRSRR